MKTKTKVNVFQLVIAMVGVFASYFAVNMFNRHFHEFSACSTYDTSYHIAMVPRLC